MSKRKRTTQKLVQSAERRPYVPPADVAVVPDDDHGAFDTTGMRERHRLFAEAYCGQAKANASEAARIAGYRDDNANALKVTAHGVLHHPHVQRYIAHHFARHQDEAAKVRASILAVAEADMASFVSLDPNGGMRLDLLKAAAVGQLGAIRELKFDAVDDGTGKPLILKGSIKLHDVVRAREIAAKMHGLLIDKVEHGGGVSLYQKKLDGVSQDDL